MQRIVGSNTSFYGFSDESLYWYCVSVWPVCWLDVNLESIQSFFHSVSVDDGCFIKLYSLWELSNWQISSKHKYLNLGTKYRFSDELKVILQRFKDCTGTNYILDQRIVFENARIYIMDVTTFLQWLFKRRLRFYCVCSWDCNLASIWSYQDFNKSLFLYNLIRIIRTIYIEKSFCFQTVNSILYQRMVNCRQQLLSIMEEGWTCLVMKISLYLGMAHFTVILVTGPENSEHANQVRILNNCAIDPG